MIDPLTWFVLSEMDADDEEQEKAEEKETLF